MYRIRYVLFVVFKQKTAYEMRISDWSSDVCSSDLIPPAAIAAEAQNHPAPDASTAWTEAAEALAIRQLLLAEAERLGIEAEAVADAEGNRLTDEDARIDALLAQEVSVPAAGEAEARRFYDRNAARFTSETLVEEIGRA